MSGTGKYDGIGGTATDTNSGNVDDTGAYQAGGKMVGAYRITRAPPGDINAMVAPYDPPEKP